MLRMSASRLRQIFRPGAKVPPIPSDTSHEGNNLVWDKWDGLEDPLRSELLRRWKGCWFSILGNVRAHDGPNRQEGDLRSPDLLPRRIPPAHEMREPVGSYFVARSRSPGASPPSNLIVIPVILLYSYRITFNALFHGVNLGLEIS